MDDEKPKPPLLLRILIFLLFASLSYGSYCLLAKNPLVFHFAKHPAPAQR